MPTTSSRNLLKSLGLVLLLTGAIVAKGEGMVVILLGGLAIVLLGLAEFRTISQENSLMIRLILSSTLALVTVIKLIESVGKSFTSGHLYLTMILIGLVLVLIEDIKLYVSPPKP
jgi:hypothetical protein